MGFGKGCAYILPFGAWFWFAVALAVWAITIERYALAATMAGCAIGAVLAFGALLWAESHR